MFLPLYDGIALQFMRRPLVTWGIIVTNIVIYALTSCGVFGNAENLDLSLGVIPAVLFDHSVLAKGIGILPAPATLITGMFLHGGLLHLSGNMLFLWVFGDNVEDAMGSIRYLFFYLAAGVGGALAYSFADESAEAPLIGASGAIAGVIAAYLLFYPKAPILGLALQYIPLRISAVWCLSFWFLFPAFSAFTTEGSNVGWWAHIGGFATGAILAPFLKRPAVPLFGARVA